MILLSKTVTVLIILGTVYYSETRTVIKFRPCGNNMGAFIEFTKSDEDVQNIWSGFMNLSFYPHLISAVIEIYFEPLITLKTLYDAARMTVVGNNFTGHYWKFEPMAGMGKTYKFDVQSAADYPYILNLTVNGAVVCTTNPVLNNNPSTTSATVNLNAQRSHDQSRPLPDIACGKRPVNYVNLIYEGDDCTLGQFPWHVAIYYKKLKNENKTYKCGGSIIARNIVLTAAHCVVQGRYALNAENLYVVAGQTVLSINNTERQENQGKNVIVYPLYNSKVGQADIALIRTRYCFVFNDYVQPVCIMGPGYDKSSLYGLYGTIVGFGLSENNTLSDKLRHANVQIQNDATCLLLNVAYQRLLNNFNFCAGNGPDSSVNACNGDSGGGLVLEYNFNSNKHWVIQGIVAVAIKEGSTNICDPSKYTVYTAVTPYFQWIMGYL